MNTYAILSSAQHLYILEVSNITKNLVIAGIKKNHLAEKSPNKFMKKLNITRYT